MIQRENTPFESFIFERCRVFIDAKEDRRNGMTRAQLSYMSQAWAQEWWMQTDEPHTDDYTDIAPSASGAICRYHKINGLKSPIA